LVGSFYEIGPKGIKPGLLVRVPSLYPNKDQLILDIKVEADPTEQNLVAAVTPFHQRSVHIPVKSLNLASNEYYFAVKGKPRPAVVLAGGYSRWPTNPSEQLYLCVPLYTVDKPRLSQKFVIEVEALRYPSMFYFPPSNQFQIEESIARFTLLQVIHGNTITQFHNTGIPIMLSTEFFGFLRTQLMRFLGSALPENVLKELKAYGDIVLEEAKLKGLG
jgi:hypothetical protein